MRDAILHYCLDELDAGIPLGDILDQFPDQAPDIRPVLELTVALPALAPNPPQAARENSRSQFLAQAQSLRREKDAPLSETRQKPQWWRRLPLAFGVFLLILVFSTLFSIATNASLPGQPLYLIKRGTETLQLALTPPDARAPLEHLFQDRRTAEIIIIIETGRTANVQGEGAIQAIDDGVWQVYGIKMQITPETQITGEPEVGRIARVRGNVRDGKYFARTITILDSP